MNDLNFVSNVENMEDKKILKKIAAIQKDLQKSGLVLDTTITELKELREMVKDLDKYPLIVKALRLTYEYMEVHETFDIQFLEDNDEPVENLVYLLQLIEHPDNKYNRDEIRELTEVIKGTEA